MWKLRRQREIDRRLVEGRVDGVVVVRHGRVPGQHHAAQSEGLDAAKILDAFLRRAERRLADAQEAVRMCAAVLREPEVVGVEAGVLVVEVGVVAEHHADRRVDDLGRHAVAVLVGQPRVRIPAPAVHVLEPRPEHGQLGGILARAGHQAHGNGPRQALDDEQVSALVVPHDTRGAVLEAAIDAVHVRVRRLGDVRVGRDDGSGHGVRHCSAAFRACA